MKKFKKDEQLIIWSTLVIWAIGYMVIMPIMLIQVATFFGVSINFFCAQYTLSFIYLVYRFVK